MRERDRQGRETEIDGRDERGKMFGSEEDVGDGGGAHCFITEACWGKKKRQNF